LQDIHHVNAEVIQPNLMTGRVKVVMKHGLQEWRVPAKRFDVGIEDRGQAAQDALPDPLLAAWIFC
jgi:hypothetical protein